MGKGEKILFFGTIIFIGCVIGICMWLKPTVISEDEVKNIVIKESELKEENVKFKTINLNNNTYEVHFTYDDSEFMYKINGETGEVLETNFDINKITEELIELKEAKSIALKHAKLKENSVKFTKQELKDKVYLIQFTYKKYNYSYEINAKDGQIIKSDKEKK